MYHLTKAREPLNGKAKTKISLWTSATSSTMFNSETNNVVYLSVVLYSDCYRSDFIAQERKEDTAYMERAKRAKRVVMIN